MYSLAQKMQSKQITNEEIYALLLIYKEVRKSHQTSEWLSEQEALQLLGCKRTKLMHLKSPGRLNIKREQ